MVYVTIHPKDYFGDIDYVVMENEGKRQFTVKALEHSEVYQLNKNDLHMLEMEFPEIIEEFFESALGRLKIAKKMMHKAEEFAL